ncbi:acyltransferase [uncultured Aliivibrio sp.]|uniref:acyltransferase n=1 Tax=uncultured Aliivibrio sp. TaxID=873085 RepID=UPI00260E1231|nr:acyltransferase [uncultured Aliivibrio sp.]
MISFQFYKKCRRYISRHLFRLLFSKNFNFFGSRVSVYQPDTIEGVEYISLGNNVSIDSKCWLLAFKTENHTPNIDIKEGACIGRFSHIVAIDKLIIESNVLIADKVYISDNVHRYTDVGSPISEQPVDFKGAVSIGSNSWIGESVSVIGSKIGKHCIIGANSVVTSDIPDYCVAVGVPARVVKRYNSTSCEWERTDINGNFLNDVNTKLDS